MAKSFTHVKRVQAQNEVVILPKNQQLLLLNINKILIRFWKTLTSAVIFGIFNMTIWWFSSCICAHLRVYLLMGTAVDVNILILTVALRRVDGVSGAA